jgi:hypothetical protein
MTVSAGISILLGVACATGVLNPWKIWSDEIEPREFAQGVEYTSLMGRDNKVCKHMLAMFNRDLAEFGVEKYDEHEEFRSIGWKKTAITRMEGDREVTDSMEAAHVDINNDGTKDLVFRWTGFMGGYEVQTLYIFQDSAPNEKLWTLMEIAHSPGRISHNGYYLLTEEPSAAEKRKRRVQIPPMASIDRLELFVFDGTTYVGMRPLYELATGSDPVNEFSKVYVITKYREGKYGGGPDPNERETGKREDICYLKIRTMPYHPRE